MKYFFIVLTMLFYTIKSDAQLPEDSVKSVINQMFSGMKQADTSLLKGCFAESMILQTITTGKDGKTTVSTENKNNFIAFIGKELPGNADERIVFETVKVDGPLAIAWTPYQFYYKGKFSHCGVNSFQLVRFNGEWKIQYLIDTRRRLGCDVR
jgi:hypothetical protein